MWCSSSEKGALGPGWGLVGNPEEADKDGGEAWVRGGEAGDSLLMKIQELVGGGAFGPSHALPELQGVRRSDLAIRRDQGRSC